MSSTQHPLPHSTDLSETADRRTFLKRTLLGGVVLLAGSGTLLALRKGKGEPVAPDSLRSFDPVVFPVAVAVVARMVPVAGTDFTAVALRMDDALSYTQPALRGDINKVLSLLENGLAGLLTRRSATPFTMLSPEGQDRALSAWRESRLLPLTGAYQGLRKLSVAAFYNDLDASKRLGYPGPLFDTPDPGPLQARGPISPPFVVAAAPAAQPEGGAK
jgi:hypothetical protein